MMRTASCYCAAYSVGVFRHEKREQRHPELTELRTNAAATFKLSLETVIIFHSQRDSVIFTVTFIL